MNIAFVSNFSKTYLFDRIAKKLQEKGYHIYWFCYGEKWFNYLVESGYSAENILLLNKNVKTEADPLVGEYKLNELIAGDRVLKYDYDASHNYLTAIQKPIYQFIKNNGLRYIFGEITYAHEILMSRICLDKFAGEVHYLHPQSIRIPNGRFTFLDTEFQDTIFERAINFNPETYLEGKDIPIQPKPPQRVVQVAQDVKKSMTIQSKLKRVKRLFTEENIEQDNPSLLADRSIRYKIALKEETNKSTYKLLNTEDISFLDNKKYVFVTLHMQPEASVDVVGRYYEDQYITVFNVWRVLPADTYLVLKEHTNAIGNRSNKFYKRCTKLKNVIFVHETTNSHTLINNAQAIFTNSGTVALEGALYGIDSFVFSRIFFSKLNKCHYITLEDLKFCKNFYDLVEKSNRKAVSENKMSIAEYSEFLYRSSFEGVVDPPKITIEDTDPENINTVAESFLMFLNTDKK